MWTLMKKISLISLMGLVLLSACTTKAPEPVDPPEPEPFVMSFTIGKNEDKYTLPVPFKDFKSNGWELEGDEDYVIPANTVLKNMGVRQKTYYAIVTFFNDTGQDIALKDALVSEFKVEHRKVKGHYKTDEITNIKVNGLLDWETSEAELMNLFDVKPVEDVNNLHRIYTYEFDTGASLVVEVRKNEATIKYITLTNLGKGPLN